MWSKAKPFHRLANNRGRPHTVCMTRPSRPTLSLLAILAVSALSTACGAPGLVDGVVRASDFSIRDNEPAVRSHPALNDFHIVLSEEENNTLKVVTVDVDDLTLLPVGEPIHLVSALSRDEGPTMAVSTGDLVVTMRSDGVRMLSSENTIYADVTDGTLVLHEVSDRVIGSFTAELDDGGYLEGSFDVVAP